MDRDTAPEYKTLHLPSSGGVENNSSSTEPSDVSVRIRSSKRKTGADGEGTRKRQRTSRPELSGDFVRVKGKKRTIADKGDRPRKRQRVSELDQRDEGTSSLLDAATPREKRDDNKSTSEETSRQEFEAKYKQLNPLGEGGHGSVYAGYRRADHFPVAIKHIPRDNVICKAASQNRKTLPLEVAAMLKMASGAAGSVGKSAAISLLDYYDLDQELILVLERPVPSIDLVKYIKVKGGSLKEEEARLIVKQLVEAARELQSKNILHRDIKVENILIESSSEVPRLRLIDFGLSCFTMKSSSSSSPLHPPIPHPLL